MSYFASLVHAFFIHVTMIILLTHMHVSKPLASSKPFRENSVVIRPRPSPHALGQSTNQVTETKHTNPMPSSKPLMSKSKIEKSEGQQKQKLGTLAHNQLKTLAEQLEQHITSDEEYNWRADQNQPPTEEESLRALLESHLALPFSGEVILTLTIDPQGSIKECHLLTELCAVDRVWILNRLHSIPFQKFFETVKISHEVTLHIKLRSD